MRRTVRPTVATGAIVLGGASTVAFLAPSALSGSSSADEDQAATTARTDTDDQATTMARSEADDDASDEDATGSRTQAPAVTFTSEEGSQKQVTFEPDRQGDRMSAQHSNGNGAGDPDGQRPANRQGAPSSREAGDREGGD